MRVISRFNKDHKGERCPKCSEVFVNFMEIDENMLACYRCGTVFVKKEIRDRERNRIIEQLAIQEKEEDVVENVSKEDEAETFPCEVCGKACKSALGLASHMRTHRDG